MSVDVQAKVDSELQKDKKRPLEEDDTENPVKVQKAEPVQRIKLKKHAMILGYLGKDYFGMQRNPGMKTIEEELLNAMYKAELINSEALEIMQTVQFQRAARTDKGVSARRQIVSVLLPEKGTEADINQFLPNDIRVFGVRRVTKGFNSKTQADARTYTYTLPTYAFAPELRPFVFGEEVDMDKRLEELSVIDGKPFHEYRLPDSLLEKVQRFFKQFEGTHNFHNFTSKVKPLDPRAKRYMISCSCEKKFISNGLEFVTLEIKGQSFMLHQIRKMVAMTISFARNIVTEDILKQSFGRDKFDIPIAPSLGLVLHYIHYDYYNKRYGKDGLHQTLDWSEIEEEIQKFENEYIMKHIVDTEINEKTMLTWLSALPNHHFGIREEENIDPQSNSEINE